MTNDLTSGFLENLAKSAPDNSLFEERAESVKTAIKSADTYETIKQQLDTLHGFDYRVPDLAFEVVQQVFDIAKKHPPKHEHEIFTRYSLDKRVC